jgi:hypothetical protein
VSTRRLARKARSAEQAHAKSRAKGRKVGTSQAEGRARSSAIAAPARERSRIKRTTIVARASYRLPCALAWCRTWTPHEADLESGRAHCRWSPCPRSLEVRRSATITASTPQGPRLSRPSPATLRVSASRPSPGEAIRPLRGPSPDECLSRRPPLQVSLCQRPHPPRFACRPLPAFAGRGDPATSRPAPLKPIWRRTSLPCAIPSPPFRQPASSSACGRSRIRSDGA